MCYLPGMDETTTWQDLSELWADMVSFAKAHPDHVFLSADEAPWMGWTAFHPESPDEGRRWKIGLADAKRTMPADEFGTAFRDCFKSPGGRQLLCAQLTGKQTLCNPVLAFGGVAQTAEAPGTCYTALHG